MKILDANMILRYLLNDIPEKAKEAERIIHTHKVLLLPEVTAEVVYVASKVYKLDRESVVSGLIAFLEMENVETNCGNVLYKGLKIYGSTTFDFVDCLLCAYHVVAGFEICTFDKKLNNLIKRESE